MFRSFLKWGGSSLTGHLVLSELAVAVPLFLLSLIVNIRSGYPTADLAWLIILPTLVGLLAGFSIWYNLTAPRIRRRGGRVDKAQRDRRTP
jgi:H+/Cl- antiporter ClcA